MVELIPQKTDVHAAALSGYSKASAEYVRGRPEYPDALLGWLRGTMQIHADARVVDLGAGTGKFTQLLQRTQARAIAVEPIEAMRAELARNVPGVPVVGGTAQAIPVGDGAVDAVTCAQSFHWFANTESLAEIHRVLAPNGRLGLVWNVRDETSSWVASLTEIMKPYEGDAPRFHSGAWRRVFPNDLFCDPEEAILPNEHVGTAQEVIVDRVLSVSFIAALPAAERTLVQARIKALIETHPGLRNLDRVSFPYLTRAFCCIRK